LETTKDVLEPSKQGGARLHLRRKTPTLLAPQGTGFAKLKAKETETLALPIQVKQSGFLRIDVDVELGQFFQQPTVGRSHGTGSFLSSSQFQVESAYHPLYT
jgi:hypothetical protein